MKHFMVTYIGGDSPSSSDEGRRHFVAYQKWLTSLNEAVIKPMVPFINTHTIRADGTSVVGSSIGMSGYSVIKADSMVSAVAMLKKCPFLDLNGSLEVAEIEYFDE